MTDTAIAATVDPWTNPTERVLGAELRAGDVVRNHGYRWKIARVEYDDCSRAPLPGPNGGLGRWYLYAAAIGEEAADLPAMYRDRMEMALREDLEWTRELAA